MRKELPAVRDDGARRDRPEADDRDRRAPSGARLSPLELAAWRGFLRTHAILLRRLDDELQAAEGLSVVAYEVLILVADSPEGRIRISELSRHTLLSLSGTSRLVDRLVRDGLVSKEPCEEDRRGANVVLTDRGRDILSRARRLHRAGVRRAFLDRLDEATLRDLAGVWRTLGGGEPAT
jgi:DNA-binding MarR family transcriptional regulator